MDVFNLIRTRECKLVYASCIDYGQRHQHQAYPHGLADNHTANLLYDALAGDQATRHATHSQWAKLHQSTMCPMMSTTSTSEQVVTVLVISCNARTRSELQSQAATPGSTSSGHTRLRAAANCMYELQARSRCQ